MAAVLGPLMVIGSAVRADTPFLWALRSWVRRQFANRSPTVIRAAPDYIDETGSITVTLSATDHDRDRLVYTATDGAKGRVTLNPDGHSFTYDPGAGATGADTFTVTATDATNFHLHGVIGLLTGRGHTARSTIAVQIPESSATADSGDPVTVGAGFGAVSGSVPVADADSPQPRYALVDQPARTTGVVVVDAQTGQWTFTPTPGARVRSFATRGVEEVATFSIAATNGAAACVPIVVSPRIRGTPIAAYPAVDGVPVGAIHMGPNGFGYQMVLRYDAGSEGYETAVAIIDPASTTPRITLPVAGVPLRLVFGPDGTAYQSTATVIPGTTTFDKYSMTVITPDGESYDHSVARHPGR